MHKNLQTIALFCGINLAIGCSPVTYFHGNKPNPQVLNMVEPGVQNKEQIHAMLGSPSSITLFEEETWLYISSQSRQEVFFKPEETERQVVAITFDGDGKVSAVATMNQADGMDIKFSKKETPTSGHSFTFLEQLFGNVGRFENKGHK